jgi:hypothetical protein
MATNEIFESAQRPAGDLAGVFEYDGEVGYFYLYQIKGEQDRKVVGAIRVLTGPPDFDERDVSIRWDATENKVGLFVKGQLCAAFDGRTGSKYGGNYLIGVQGNIPPEIIYAFES